ncbi:MAG: cyanophycin synthetase, partial [Sutterellaceae bacterium]|nr:cyanophycin synthetase [Sutterellaceae bacterium]
PVTGKKAQLAAEDPQKSLLMPVEALQIKGRHNAMNALAALALIEAAGLNLAKALQVLKTYRGEAHRVQSVLKVGDIEFIDDSKGTNVGAVIAALTGLGKSGRKCALVMGGDGKGQDFSPLAEVVGQYARFVSVIGQDAEKIAQALTDTGVEVKNCGKDFEDAVRSAYGAAQSGDAVLLSPACASWDMFKNYAQRSAIFVDIAHAILKEYEESQKVARGDDDLLAPQTDAEAC